MFSAFLSLCLLASALASPVQIRSSPVTLPIAVKVNSTGGSKALLARDKARFKALFAHGQAKAKGDLKALADAPVPVADAAQIYTANVGVGSQSFSLIVDTGSSNTWVGAGTKYQPGANSQDTGEQVSVSYGSGNFRGEEFIDTITLGSTTITDQSIGAASSSTGFDGFDGILGIGPDDLTQGTTSGGENLPTVTDNMKQQGTIDSALVGVSFVPTTSASTVQNGELDFGATDSGKFTGEVAFVPITNQSPASQFWGIDQSITYGSNTPILSSTAGIVDTGTTLVLLATDAFQAYQSATGATMDRTTGLLRVDSVDSLESLFFHVGGNDYELTANGQIWPRALNSQIGGEDGATYLIVADVGTPSGQGLDFINGFTFLQRFYSVYDTDNSQVGFATTAHTMDTTN